MKFKTTAIAMAVAGTVAAPVAVQAGADEIYASARVGLKYTDTGDVADFDVNSFASRFGMRGETDLGNGLTGFGRYEVSMDFNGGGSITNRHRYVGLKGDWGSLTMGQTYHTWYNFVSGPLDIPWWHSLGADIHTAGRTDNAITYAGGSGAIGFGVTAYFDRDEAEETAPDGIEAAVSFGLGDSTIGVGISTVDEDGAIGAQGQKGGSDRTEDIIGVTWSGIGIGDTTLGVGYQNQDDDDSFALHWDIANFYVNASMLTQDAADRDVTDITLGYTQSLGRKTTMYYEVNTKDNDTGNSDDDYSAFMAVLKYDII